MPDRRRQQHLAHDNKFIPWGNIPRKDKRNVERIQDTGLDEARRDGDPQGRVLPGQGRAGALRPHLSQDPGQLRLLDPGEDNPGREEVFYKYAKTIEETIAAQPDALAVLQLHYLRWVLFPIKGETYFMYQGIFDTDFDKYTEDAVTLFGITGLRTVFENLEGFPMDWQTNPAAFVKFVRDHQCPSFLEYAEYPYVSATEIKKALKLKAAFSTMLDQMQ